MTASDPEVGPNEYRCECCKQVFEKARTDEEAAIELHLGGFIRGEGACALP